MSNQQRGQQWLEELLRLSNVSATVQVSEECQDSKANYWLTIEQSQLTEAEIQTLIGVNGKVLDALQYLANATLNLGKPLADQAAYTVELNGYRLQRQEELRILADQAAQKVRETGQDYELRSLSAAERRQVHRLLQECEDLETHSQGQEPNRHLVVRLRP